MTREVRVSNAFDVDDISPFAVDRSAVRLVTSVETVEILFSVAVTRLVKEVSESAAAVIALKLASTPDKSIASKVAVNCVTSEDNALNVALS